MAAYRFENGHLALEANDEGNGRCLLVPLRATVFSSPLAECVGNSHEALSLETRSPSQEPCYRTENAHRMKDKMHARLCAEDCSYIRDITLPKSGPTSVCM